MKQAFLINVLIYSLLLAVLLTVCGCSNDLSSGQEKDLESPQDTEIEQKETDNNEDDKPDEQGQNEPELPEIESPEAESPEVEPMGINLLVINELRTVYSSAAKRTEYIEFKVMQAGNLNGISLHIMYNAKTPFIYNFPDINAASGEYITLHFRTLESACVNELSDDLSISGGTDSCPTARDLWVSGSSKLLHQTDIVYLQDAKGRIMDAIIMNEAPDDTWKKNQAHFAQIAEDLYNRGMWKSIDGQMPKPYDAVDTSTIKTSATKSISRYEGKVNTHTANDWYITDSNKLSPGQPNK